MARESFFPSMLIAPVRFGVAAMVLLAACDRGEPTDGSSKESPDSSSAAALCEGAQGNWGNFPAYGQCVHGVIGFYAAQFGAPVPGLPYSAGGVGSCRAEGACNLWVNPNTQPNPAIWNKYAWGATTPQTYDMVVFGPSSGSDYYGHVASVDHMDGSTLFVMDDNWNGTGAKATCVHSLGSFQNLAYGVYRLKALEPVQDQPPAGFLDSVACTSVAGWSQDPDVATQAINVDLYFGGPAGSGVPSVRTVAGNARPDLCTAIGSCNHGFSFDSPRGLLDGSPHAIHAYGIDANGSDNAELSNSPQTLTCTSTEAGVRRPLTSASVAAWAFAAFQDVRPVSSTTFDGYTASTVWPSAPRLIQATGSAAVYVVDGPSRRWVSSTTSAAEWHLDLTTIQQVSPEELQAMPAGPDLRQRPMLIQVGTGEIDVLDDPPTAPNSSTGNRWITALNGAAGGETHVFVRGADGNLAHADESQGAWSAFASLNQPIACGSAASNGPTGGSGIPEVFSPGAMGASSLDSTYAASRNGWNTPVDFGGAGLQDFVSLPWPDGHVDVFALDATGSVWNRSWDTDGGTWADWSSLGGAFAETPLAIIGSDGAANLFTVDAAGMAWYDESGDYPGGWSGWRELGADSDGGSLGLASRPVPVQWPDGHLEVFATTTAGNLVAASQGRTWEMFTTIAMGASGEPSVTLTAGQPEVFVRDAAGHVAHTQPLLVGWVPLTLVGMQPSALDPFVWQELDGTLDVFAAASDASGALTLQVRSRSPVGSWGDWSPLGGAISNCAPPAPTAAATPAAAAARVVNRATGAGCSQTSGGSPWAALLALLGLARRSTKRNEIQQ